MSEVRSIVLRLVLAFGLSFALWMFVSFSENPEETARFEDLSLQIVGLAENLIIVDDNGIPTPTFPNVDVSLRTDRRQRSELRPLDIRVVADLTGLGPGDHLVPINVQPTRSNLSFSVPADGVDPPSIVVRLEPLAAITLPINLEIVGSPPFSFERGTPDIRLNGEPISTVTISGPESRVAKVANTRAVANISQLRATYVAPLSIVAVDANNQPVEGVQVRPPTVTVTIPINPVVGLRLVPVAPIVIGAPAPGYTVTAIEVEPPLITLTGSSGPLDAISLLQTEAIDIQNARESIIRIAPLIVPNGTSPAQGEPNAVQVTVKIEPIPLPFQVRLPVEVALSGVSAELIATVTPNVVEMTFSGASDQLTALAATPLVFSIDVSAFVPGVYPITVQPSLPSGISIVGEPPEVTVIIRAIPTPTPEPEPEPTVEPSPTPEGGG